MGLDKVVKDISDKAETESKSIAAKAAADAAAEKKAAEAQAKEIVAAELGKADLAVSKMRQRELSSAKLDVKKAKLNAEKDVLAEVHAGYVKRLAALPREKKVDIFNKLISLARKEIPAGKIYTNAADADLVASSGYEYGGNIKCIGGIVVTSSDGSINLDYTFDSILEDVWNSSMKPVSDMLFGNRWSDMAFLRTKGGNFAYAATRVKVRKSFLFTRETYLKLLQMSLPEISRFIEESKYKQEIDELATKYSGIDLLEYALNLNLARDMSQVQGFCQGELQGLIGAYLMRWDVWNIKSILRGKFSGATDEEIRETFVPAGSIKPETLAELVKKPNIPEVVEGLTGTIFYKPLLNAMDSYNKTHTISDLENSLDKAYYNYMATLPVPKMNATALFINFVQREIDFTNLRTLFRLKRAGLEYDKIMDYMIPGGSKLKTDDLRKMAQAPSFDEFVNMLKEYPYWADLAEAVENYRETKSLNAVEIALYKGLMGYANKISHLYPLSVTPILGYAINKNVEINNLRTIARGKEMHLSDETIKSQLVI